MGQEEAGVSVAPDAPVLGDDTDVDGFAVPRRTSWTRRLVKITALWALVEFPMEFWVAPDDMQRLALALATVIWLLLAFYVLRGSAAARGTLAFLCVLSVIAIAPALPAEYAGFRVAFWLSLVECALKGLLFVALLSSRHTAVSG
ncbi:hypothetical protein [Paraburkholderia sp. BR14320]|uniref:hypothetical protein n=1 Tax=unclassified Paraburkholderia TaxID=2615204 RepID=UPI0034CE0F36